MSDFKAMEEFAEAMRRFEEKQAELNFSNFIEKPMLEQVAAFMVDFSSNSPSVEDVGKNLLAFREAVQRDSLSASEMAGYPLPHDVEDSNE